MQKSSLTDKVGATLFLLAALSSNFHLSTASCTDGDISLHPQQQSSAPSNHSVIKVCMDGKWWLVDAENWTDINTVVACRSLGFPEGTSGYVYQKTELVSEIICRGDELDLSECILKIRKTSYHNNNDEGSGEGSGNLVRSVDGYSSESGSGEFPVPIQDHDSGSGSIPNHAIKTAVISCTESNDEVPPTICNETDIQLIPIANHGLGKLGIIRICDNGEWTVLCSSTWTNNESSVACSQLGYVYEDSTALTASLPQSHSHSKIINGDSFKCSGKQATSLQSCKEQSTALVMQDNSCPNSYGFAAVQCKEKLCKDGEMKYMSSSVPNNEVLDVVIIMACYKGSWKPVCDTNWSHEDASVLCKAAHYTPQGALPIQLTSSDIRYYKLATNDERLNMSFECKGKETNLSNCQSTFGGGSSRCPAGGISSALCSVSPYSIQNCKQGSLRLAGGNSKSHLGHGDLQICINNIWGGISYGSSMVGNRNGAIVACRELGFKGSVTWFESFEYSPMFFMKLSCQGNESRLSECIKLSEAFEYIFDDIHDYSSGTKIQCVKPTSVLSIRPQEQMIARDSLDRKHSVNFSCIVTGEFPINVTWSFVSANKKDSETIFLRTEILSDEANIQYSILSVEDAIPLKNGRYVCSASNVFGEDEKQALLSVTVESTSSIAFTPKFGIMNQTSTILCSASGNPRLKLKLTKDGITLKETSDNSSDSLTKKGLYLSNLEYTINQTTSSDRGIYTCEAAGQRVTHSSEFFDVWSYPKMLQLPENQTIYTNNPSFVTLGCSVQSNPRSIIQWFKMKMNCDNEIDQVLVVANSNYSISSLDDGWKTESALTIKATSINVGGTYICMARNSLGYVKASATVSIKSGSQFSLKVSVVDTDLPTKTNDTVIILCQATSASTRMVADGIDIHWERNKVPIKHSDYHTSVESAGGSSVVTWNSHLVLRNVTANTSGVYSCLVQDKIGPVIQRGSASITVVVEDHLEIRLINNSPQVKASSMKSYITVNKPGVTMTCSIDNNRTTKDCTSGVVEFTDIWCIEPYQMINFTVTATKQREVATLVRPFYPETHLLSCGINLINDGVVVQGNTVTVEFTGINIGHAGSAASPAFSCRLQGRSEKCISPWVTRVSKPGQYHLRIRALLPQCRRRKAAIFQRIVTV